MEETGYKVKKFVEMPYPTMYSDPWRSSESILLYAAMVDGDDREVMVGQNLDWEENIRVYKVALDRNLMKSLEKLAKEN